MLENNSFLSEKEYRFLHGFFWLENLQQFKKEFNYKVFSGFLGAYSFDVTRNKKSSF